MTTCELCGLPFERIKSSKRFCSEACRTRASSRRQLDARLVRVHAEKVDRACLDCGASLADRRRDAVRCRPCSKRHSDAAANARRRRLTNHQATVTSPKTKPAPKPKPAPVPKPRKPVALKPNLGGDWFPGWTGCWPSSRTPEEIAMIERGRQLLDADERRRQAEQPWRYSNLMSPGQRARKEIA